MNHLSRRDERPEDDMADYSYIEKTVSKVYAFRFRGYWSEIPQFFKKDLRNNGYDRDRNIDVVTYRNEHGDTDSELRYDDVIVVVGSKTKVMSRNRFEDQYQSVFDFSKFV